MIVVEAIAGILAAIVLLHGSWWTALGVLAIPSPRQTVVRQGQELALVVIVPAHNESGLIAACIESLRRARQRDTHEILVVADNCSDSTASIARSLGATVIERDEPTLRGKSYALDTAIAALASRTRQPSAVLFVDADSTVSVEFFDAISDRLARGDEAVQVHYAAAPGTSSLGRLRRLAFLLIHWARPLGASRIGAGTTLKGNGMAISWRIASEGLGGFGLTEDAGMTLSLAARGVSVKFEPRATVTGFMAQDYTTAATQDERWERGRRALAFRAVRTAARCATQRQFTAATSALEVATLPLSTLVLLAALAVVAGAVAGGLILPVAAALSLVVYVGVGLIAARAPLHDICSLVTVPRFLLHKTLVYARGTRRGTEWRRTDR